MLESVVLLGQCHTRFFKDSRRGASLLEVVVVISIASILLSKASVAFASARSATQVRSAVEAYAGMASLARAQAIEHGSTVRLETHFTTDSVSIIRNGQVTQGRNLGAEHGVDLRSASRTNITVCFSPKGYAEPSCNSFAGNLELQIRSGSHSTDLGWLEMGQLVR